MDREMILRMSCVLGKAVDVYTEINMEDYRYQQIDFAKNNIFNLDSEGDYVSAFEYMINEIIEEEDVKMVRDVLSPEKLEEAFNQPKERNMSVRYRMQNSNPVIWMESMVVLLREIRPIYVCFITKDVTKDVQFEDIKADNIKRSEYERQLEQQQERIRSLLDGTNTIVYEYDIAKDVMSFAGNAPYTKEKMDYAVHNYLKEYGTYENIYEDDKDNFLKAFKDAVEHGGNREIRYRANYFAKGYRWYKAFIMRAGNAPGVPERIIGRVDDIHTEVEMENGLRKRAEMDELTGVLNKATITERVYDILNNYENGKLGALYIFDIDNFKMVNDKLGHLFGDFFLQTVASEISRHFGQYDLVGRIGGDEFMAYLSDAGNEKNAADTAERILKACRRIEVPVLKTVKCSIGIALISNGRISYEQLFENADAALYTAKEKGKDSFILYDPSEKNRKADWEKGRFERKSFRTVEVEQTLSQYVFHMLYNAVDIEKMISAMLKFMGEYMNVSRAYILEQEEDDKSWNNTFEWHAEGICPQLHMWQNISLEDMENDYLINFNAEGIFYCKKDDLRSKTKKGIFQRDDIISMLQCTILDGGNIWGIVGFDECTRQQRWTKEQIEMIRFSSQVLSSFLIKKRTQDEIKETSRSMYEVLDKANSCIYIVDPDTYLILYANAEATRLLGEDCAGKTCYKKTFNLDHPCRQCPIQAYKEKQTICSMQLFNPLLDRWFEVEAKPIRWKQKENMMVQSKDITGLMRRIEELENNKKE